MTFNHTTILWVQENDLNELKWPFGKKKKEEENSKDSDNASDKT